MPRAATKKRKKRRKPITHAELSRLAVCDSPDLPQYINLYGRRKWWAGIGWVDNGDARGDEVEVVD